MLATQIPLLLALFAPGAGSAAIPWHASVDAAVAAAGRDGAPVFVAVNMDGDPANDEAVEVLYRDEVVVRLASHAACLFASRFDHGSGDRPCPRSGTVTCAEHMAVEKAIRAQYLRDQGTRVVAPQHLWLDPKGEVLLSVPYKVSKGELEWCFVTALRRLRPDFVWELSGAARAPKRLVNAGVAAGDPEDGSPPPTRKEVEQIIADLRQDPRPWEKHDEVARLLRSPDKKALDMAKVLLTSGPKGGGGGKFGGRAPGGGGGEGGGGPGSRITGWKTQLLLAIGRSSPPEYHAVVAPLLEDDNPAIRRHAAVALEELADAHALGALTKAFKGEEDPDVRRELIRAIASCGRAAPKAVQQVQQVAARDKDDVVRVNAVVGAASLEDNEAVHALARSALFDPLPALRAGGAYVVAVRREAELRPLLDEVLSREKDDAVKSALERALRVLDGAAADELEPILRDFAHSDIPRDRRG